MLIVNPLLVCLIVGLPLAGAAGNAQTPWLEAIEDRLAVTAKALGSMKAIKMTGLADIVSATIRQLRLDEISASLRWRVLNIFVTVSCKNFTIRISAHGHIHSMLTNVAQILLHPPLHPYGDTEYTSS